MRWSKRSRRGVRKLRVGRGTSITSSPTRCCRVSPATCSQQLRRTRRLHRSTSAPIGLCPTSSARRLGGKLLWSRRSRRRHVPRHAILSLLRHGCVPSPLYSSGEGRQHGNDSPLDVLDHVRMRRGALIGFFGIVLYVVQLRPPQRQIDAALRRRLHPRK